MTTERFSEKETFMFQGGPSGSSQLLQSVELVVVTGMYDHLNRKYVDPPRATSGYGVVRPERVAELLGIKR